MLFGVCIPNYGTILWYFTELLNGFYWFGCENFDSPYPMKNPGSATGIMPTNFDCFAIIIGCACVDPCPYWIRPTVGRNGKVEHS